MSGCLLGLKASLGKTHNTAATTWSKVPELKGYLKMGLRNLHLKKKIERAGEEKTACRKIFCGECGE